MRILKKTLSLLILSFLLLAILSGCTPNIPSNLTAPPSGVLEENTKSSTELNGIGTICDIVEYKDGYLILAHMGLYTVDRNFENRKRLGAPYNAPFDDCKEYSFFHRLTIEPNYDDPMFCNLNINGEHIFFSCPVTNSIFIDGQETKLADCGLSMMDDIRVDALSVAYGDSFFVYYRDFQTTGLIYNGAWVQIGDGADGKDYRCPFAYEGKIYLMAFDSDVFTDECQYYWRELHEDLSLGEIIPVEKENADPTADISIETENYRYFLDVELIESEPDEDGNTEILRRIYSYHRTQGDKVEYLECEGVDYLHNTARRMFCFVKEDRQFIFIRLNDNYPEIITLDFTVRK